MVLSLIPTLPKSWKESKHLRNDVQNPPSSTITHVQRQSTEESQQWNRAPEKSVLSTLETLGRRSFTFWRKLQQLSLCHRAGCGDETRALEVQPCAAEEQVVPWHKHCSSSCCTGQKGLCGTAQPLSRQHNGHRRNYFIRINKISLIYTCGAIKTKHETISFPFIST